MNNTSAHSERPRGTGAPFVQVNGVSKTYGMNNKKVAALRDITFDFERGDTLSIVGASGAGKSTLLHILGALDHPSSGQVYYLGKDLFSMNARELAKFRNSTIGFIFQFHYLLPEFTALENTMMPALINGLRREEAIHKAEQILADVGLRDRVTHKQGELSGGEQQRVAIARALMLTPELILADEPTGNLDSCTGEAIFDLLLSLNQSLNITLLVVTHNERIAEKMGRRITLRDGLVVAP